MQNGIGVPPWLFDNIECAASVGRLRNTGLTEHKMAIETGDYQETWRNVHYLAQVLTHIGEKLFTINNEFVVFISIYLFIMAVHQQQYIFNNFWFINDD
jgi:hypothetical protein